MGDRGGTSYPHHPRPITYHPRSRPAPEHDVLSRYPPVEDVEDAPDSADPVGHAALLKQVERSQSARFEHAVQTAQERLADDAVNKLVASVDVDGDVVEALALPHTLRDIGEAIGLDDLQVREVAKDLLSE